ncbi:MAG: BtpA/SgcQ family protein [Planctomycetota bacterium]
MTRVASWFTKLFGTRLPLIGVVHLEPLPGSPAGRLSVRRILERAQEDGRAYLRAGFNGLILENFGDTPFLSGPAEPHTIALLSRIGAALKDQAGDRPVGVNLLRNDGVGALGAAIGAGLDFIRVNVLSGVFVTDQGLIEGRAAELLRYRKLLGSSVRVFADHRVKHAAPLRREDVDVEVDELVKRAHADALLVTGSATGIPPTAESVAEVQRAAGAVPVLVASGTSLRNLESLARHADGFIVGTSVKVSSRTGGRVDPARARALSGRLARLRS